MPARPASAARPESRQGAPLPDRLLDVHEAAGPLPVAAPLDDRILRPRDVCTRTGLSRTTIWRLVRRGEFPAPRRLSANAIGWLASEVAAWMVGREKTRATS